MKSPNASNATSRTSPRAAGPRTVLAVLAVLAVAALAGARRAEAQNFAVGVGGGFVNDSASTRSASSFSTGSFHLFGEVYLEKTTSLQLRLGSMSLPPSDLGGPNVKADHAEFLAQYLFDWEWFRGGFVGGAGVVKLTPKSLEEGQVPVDVKETVFSLMGGVVSLFQVTPNLDVRIEADFYWFNSQTTDRVPLVLGASLSYSF